MRAIRAISHESRTPAHAGEPVPHTRGNPHEHIRVGTAQLDHVNTGRPEIAIIEQRQSNAANRNGEPLSLQSMSLPGFYGARLHLGEVAFTEVAEIRSISADHVQHRAPVILDLAKLRDRDSADVRESD